jgi:hypothetical protein
MRLRAAAILFLLAQQVAVRADYDLPGFQHGMRQITSVVDATVTDFTPQGHARLRIHGTIKGKDAPAVIKGVHLSCERGSPQAYGMKKGSRYIVLMKGNNLYEEPSYFPVEERRGELVCDASRYSGWFGDRARWMKVADLSDQIRLDGLATLDADTVAALAAFKGHALSLNGLTALDGGTAAAVVGVKSWTGGVPNLTAIDAAAAKVLAEADGWDGHLPGLTAFVSPDSVAVARALATRKGPLALPNLEKISPRTLSALIAKEDVDIPLIEKLKLIPEPDGSPTDDFVIPAWLQARQEQQERQQADQQPAERREESR